MTCTMKKTLQTLQHPKKPVMMREKAVAFLKIKTLQGCENKRQKRSES